MASSGNTLTTGSYMFDYTIGEVVINVSTDGTNTYNQGFQQPRDFICGDKSSTWDGLAWSNGVPDSKTKVVFTGNYNSSGDLEACSVTVSNAALVTFSSNHTLIVEGSVTVDLGALLTIENNAALRQINDDANSGDIVLNRDSAPMIRLDYTAWSSPVSGQQLLAFSPNTIFTRFYEYLYTGTTTPTAYQSVDATSNFEVGKGYMIRVANTWSSTVPTAYNGVFQGVPTNGDVVQTVGMGYNLIGNPYPSPVDADIFLTDNPSVGTLYFWTHTVPASGGVYPVNNFASYTTLGGTASAAGGEVPNGIIQNAQGFYVQATSAGDLNFFNTQRVNASLSSQFFKATVEKHRFWLNLNDNVNNYNQILIGYAQNATNGFDNLIDGKTLDKSNSMIYNLIDNEEYVIQGKALPFNDNDVVELGFKAINDGVYNISFETQDGLFETQSIYIHDKYEGIIHDVKLTPYIFTSQSGVFNDRFEVVYKDGLIDNDLEDNSNVLNVFSNDNGLNITSSLINLNEVIVFDILGRKLFEKKNINSNTLQIKSILTNNMTLIVKTKLTSGKIDTRKIIYQIK
ncbi:hypothetical protein KK2020170_11750 [Flavobacterium okayamense]|uniref:Por secretion system C-terminal sorting domain-containing protein n=1 Tax=Flavobacterium okayamense TaxID=2830782 RepID=A0ABM7SC01_9FLAO|nr:hypothetical protein KK2020170_11750 [Flavobacterium okayamense]